MKGSHLSEKRNINESTGSTLPRSFHAPFGAGKIGDFKSIENREKKSWKLSFIIIDYFFRFIFARQRWNFQKICKYFHPIHSSFTIFYSTHKNRLQLEQKKREEKMCVYFSREQTSVDSSLSWKENRKTVCFLLFCQLLLTHFRYSIKLIGKSFIIERKILPERIQENSAISSVKFEKTIAAANVWN